MLDIDANRAPPAPRDATTVVWVRDREGKLEVLAVARSKESRFLGGAVVFPGGRLDDDDSAADWSPLIEEPAPRGLDFARDEAHLRALAIAGCRESLEEVGLLPVSAGGRGRAVDEWRAAVDRSSQALREALTAAQVRLTLGELVPFARWVTPEAEARRFDARFFLARAPEHQTARHDAHETTSSTWASPASLLDLWEQGSIMLAPPTHRTLDLLAACASVDHALAMAERSCLDPICPKLVEHVSGGDTAIVLALPGDPAHDVREIRSPGKTRYALLDGRFVPVDAPSR